MIRAPVDEDADDAAFDRCNTVVKIMAGISTGILVLLRRRSMPLNPATLRFPNVMLGATSWTFNAGAGACARIG